MYILGINPGHNGTAALLKDGKIIACISEERFSRLKNHVGFPHRSVQYVLQFADIQSKDLDYVIFSTIGMGIGESGQVYDTFKSSYIDKSFAKRVFGNLTYKYPEFMDPIIRLKHRQKAFKLERRRMKNLREIANFLRISEEKIIYIDHHLSHALSPCFNLPQDKKTLVFSLDGEGDGLCASVNIFDPQKKVLTRIAETPKSASLGYLYALVTLYLGMKPNEHEFKVMGLAPYAKQEKVKEVYDLFKKIIWIEGLSFQSSFRMQYADSFLQNHMKYLRFDSIAGAIQQLSEDLICQWVRNSIKKTGIDSIALTGGVMMNVKASQRIYAMPEVQELFVMPSAGDESTAIGACFYGYKTFCDKNNVEMSLHPLNNLYLGPLYDDDAIGDFINKNNLVKKYFIKKPKDISKEAAKLLAKGEIVARCSGRSEFGARALGNRSILANPNHPNTIKVLNETIKDRDFWMPFTPSILNEDAKDYILNPKKMYSPYMTLTFPSTKKAQEDLPAAMHPYDQTIRIQMVSKAWNPEYHALLKEFKRLTGIGGVLNTSFNLHGEPNVLTPEDAIHTVENSALKYLVLGNYLLEKKGK